MSGPPRLSVASQLAGRYTLQRELGQGGSATVFLAYDATNDRSVAIKFLRPELADSKSAARFLREIQVTATLQHPHIASVLDTGESDGQLYYVLPYMEEGTLRQRLTSEKQLPVSDAINIARTLAETLEYAHRQGILHRDIKPENILFSGGQACIADFGIARALERVLGETSTTAGVIRGTVAYMSPEQAAGASDYDGRSDVFSLGCVLYEMLAGVQAYIGPTAESIMAQRLVHRPRDIHVYRPGLPDSLSSLIERATAVAPVDRFRSAGDMEAALRAVELEVGSSGVSGPARQPGKRLVKRGLTLGRSLARRHPVATASIAALALLGIIWSYNMVTGESLGFGDRDWVLVADFEGPPDDPGLATTMRELVTTSLNQSKTIATVTRQQLNAVMRLAGLPETTLVSVGLARQLAVRSAVRVIVAGSIQQLESDRYSLVLHVVSADSGRARSLPSEATTASEPELVREIGELTRRVRQRLGERREAVEATIPLVEAATPSFRAYRTFMDGLTRVNAGDMQGSNRLLREAIAIDSGFAAAWTALGSNFMSARQIDSAQKAFQVALGFPNRLTNAQQYRLKGDIAYTVDHDLDAAIRWYDLYVSELPRSIGGRNQRALYLSAAGRYDAAAADLKATVEDNPFGPGQVQIPLFNLTAMLVSIGNLREAETTVRELGEPFAGGARLLIAAAKDDWLGVDSIAAAIGRYESPPALIALLGRTGRAAALAMRGSVTAAEQLLTRERGASVGAAARWYDRCLLLLDVAYGTPVPPPSNDRPDSSTAGLLVSALRGALQGDTLSARRNLLRVSAAPAREQAQLGYGPALVDAMIAAKAGKWSSVTDALAAPAVSGEHDATFLDRTSSIELRWLVATSYEARGRLDSAVMTMQNVLAWQRVPAGHQVLRGLMANAAHDRLANWYDRLGNHTAANEHRSYVLRNATQPDSRAMALLSRARSAAVPDGRPQRR